MTTKKRVAVFRRAARQKLRGNWGKMALIYFVSFLISLLITGIWTVAHLFISFMLIFLRTSKFLIFFFLYVAWLFALLPLLITPAITFGLTSASLKLVRDGRFRISDIFRECISVYWKSIRLHIGEKFFLSYRMIILAFVSYVLLALAHDNWLNNSFQDDSATSVLLTLALLVMISGIVLIFIKLFSYSMSYHFLCDHHYNAIDCITESCFLMDHAKGKLFRLYISYIGWFILAIPTGGILLFWLIPYISVAKAELYNELHQPISEICSTDIYKYAVESSIKYSYNP